MEAERPSPVSSIDEGRRHRRLWRVAILLVSLSFVSMWASSVITRNKLRTTWRATLQVGVVLLAPGGVPREKRRLVEERLPRLTKLFTREFHRYRPDSTLDPVTFELAGSVGVEQPPPMPPDEESYIARGLHAFRLSRYLSRVNEQAGVNPVLYDARIYVMLEPSNGSQPRSVEGVGAKNGEVGFVTAQLDRETADLTLLAVGHEFLHTVGATDKYDTEGRTDSPEFLPEPNREPRYPQRFAEIMVGEIALSPVTGRVPDQLDEVAVGPVTAREVGWQKADEATPALAAAP